MLGHNFMKKRERSCHSCVCASMAIEASYPPLMIIHTQQWQLLFHFLLKMLLSQHVKQEFGSWFYFFLGDNEGNYNFWDQEINLKGGWIVLFWASESKVLEEKTKRCDIRRYLVHFRTTLITTKKTFLTKMIYDLSFLFHNFLHSLLLGAPIVYLHWNSKAGPTMEVIQKITKRELRII